ncbi:MAG: anti-sigma factor [Salinibacter sp.]|uniref:anti-sigma factor family protein n=1 Tax=Salinibacter sp. TaxID=2065818 RepID=UPI0035D48952
MSTHSEYEDLMTEALFDEIAPEDRRRLDEHLETCADCRDEYERLQATLEVIADRERAELPPSYWASFRRRVLERVDRPVSIAERLSRWWHSLPVLLPQTGGQWAVQGAVAVLFVALGLWMGQANMLSTPSGGTESPDTARESSLWTDVLLGQPSTSLERERVRPRFRGIRDLSFDQGAGRVHVRYSVVNEMSVSGPPDAPAIRRLLRAALLSDRPAPQLNAVQTLEQASVRPTDDLVRALTVLLRTDDNSALRVRAVRALRRMHADTPLDASTRSLLVGLVLDDNPAALRIGALQTLRAAPDSSAESGYLYALRDDPNDYLRYQARSALQTVALNGASNAGRP